MSTQIPAEFVRSGYEIVTSSGRLIEKIEPEPSAEEKERIFKEEAEQKRLRKLDQALIRRYSSVSDIEAERVRKLAQLDTDLNLRKLSLEKLSNETTLWQGKAADEERRGQAVSPSTLEKLESLQRENESQEAQVQQKISERLAVVKQFEENIERFRKIRPR